MSTLDQPAKAFVGGPSATKLRRELGIETVGDLVRHYPRRYVQRGELTDLGALPVGEVVTVLAEIKSISSRRMKYRKGTVQTVAVTDGTGQLTVTFFNQPFLVKKWHPGQRGLFSGRVEVFNRTRRLAHPDHFVLDFGADADSGDAALFARSLVPVYPATADLTSWNIARAVRTVLDVLGDLPDPIPGDVRARRGLVGLAEAFHLMHLPETLADVERARARLRFEEALVLQVELARRRAATSALAAVPRVAVEGGLVDALDARLPFALTSGQREVGDVLTAELARPHPMHRLLQGEVGSGKTVVALRAMLAVVDAGGQAALLAPTEVLAQQHHRSITALLGPLAERGLLGGSEVGTRVALLTGSQGQPTRRQALLDAASGDAGIVVGTHALLEEKVEFFDLGLVVVDEQHRFGVEQRSALSGKGRTPPHVLVMTATPIPRTVAMTVFGDLEVSTLTELPAGRSVITTHVVPTGEKPHYLGRAWERVREEVAAGHQVYVVCPRIGDGQGADDLEPVAEDAAGPDAAGPDADAEDAEGAARPPLAVLDIAPSLVRGPLAGLRVEVLHGRMAPDAKDDVMRRFVAGEVDVLVATTVIEVGVDVPNATVMVVMDADRFGVSQLHQLRGRVGRGVAPGLCLLVTEAASDSPAGERLAAVADTLDGFVLSRLDLAQRREGDVLGASQSGRRSSLRLLSVLRDEQVIVDARDDAATIVAADPTLEAHPALAAAVADWVDEEHAEYLEKA